MRTVCISIVLLLTFNVVSAYEIRGDAKFIGDVNLYLDLFQYVDMSAIRDGLTGKRILNIASLKGIYHKDYTQLDEKWYGSMPNNILAFYWNGYIVFNDINTISKFKDTLFHEVGHAYYYRIYGKASTEEYADAFALIACAEIDILVNNTINEIDNYGGYEYEVY